MESLTENRLNETAPVAIFQVHEKCFTLPFSEFEQIKMRNGAIARLKTSCNLPVGLGPPVRNHCTRKSIKGSNDSY